MRQRLIVLTTAAAAAAGVLSFVPVRASAPPPQVSFYTVPSQTANPASLIRDAKKVGGVIQAVGTSRNAVTTNADAAHWIIDRVNPPVMTLLPDFANTAGGQTNAEAISSNGAYIAAQARTGTFLSAARVATAGLSLINLNAAPFTVFNQSNSSARAISDTGSIVYGQVTVQVPVLLNNGSTANRGRQRAVRFDVASGSSAQIYSITGPTDTEAQPIAVVMQQRGASDDGSVAIGQWSRSQGLPGQPALPPNEQAFRYVNSGGAGTVTNYPRLPSGGTYNRPIVVSPNGNLTMLFGNSTENPNGEIYIHNSTNGAISRLGSPKPAWTMNLNLGGMSSDASVVAATFAAPGTGSSTGFGYFHNINGWFHITAAIAGGGVNLAGWERFYILGVSPDATLVWGFGIHNGVQEGFVAEFPTDYLKNFDVPPQPLADTSIVGAWSADGTGNPDTANPTGVIVFMRNGAYYYIDSSGFERGSITFDGTMLTAITRQDTTDDGALADGNGMPNSVGVNGNVLTHPAGCTFDSNNPDACFVAKRITHQAGEIYGAWLFGDASQSDGSGVVVLTSSGKYIMAEDGDPVSDPGGQDGIEVGTYTWNAANNVVTTTQTIDTNGQWGLSHPIGTATIVLSSDELALTFADNTGATTVLRVIDPATVTPAITSALALNGTATVPLAYTITATRAMSFGVSGAAWLSVNAATGAVTGTPPAAGTFNITVSATNSLGDSGSATLVLTIAPPNTSTGSGVAVAPQVPAGGSPINLTFGNVTGAGETTVTAINPGSAPPPPSGFQLGPVYYDIATTATFNGQVQICFSYAGSTGTPRLFHYENGSWIDITSSVDPATQTICGLTSSFSPFAVFVSPIVRTGFYAPVSQVPGYVNTAKAGSTVPLKFNVYVNGVEKTDTSGLAFSVATVGCSAGPEDPVDFVTSGDTSLKYDGQQFHQNWKTPKTPGCYVVRMTTAADGLSLVGLFRLK